MDRPGDQPWCPVPDPRRCAGCDVRRRLPADARPRLHTRPLEERAALHARGVGRVSHLRAEESAGPLGDARRAVLRGSRDLHVLRAAAVPARPVRQPEGLHGRRARGRDRRRGADRRRLPRPPVPAPVPQADDAADRRGAAERRDPRRARPHPRLLARPRAARRLGAGLRRRDADPPGVPERHDPVAPARDRALLRVVDGVDGRSRHPARARQGGRRLQLRDLTGRRRRDPADRRPVPLPQPPGAGDGRHRNRRGRTADTPGRAETGPGSA